MKGGNRALNGDESGLRPQGADSLPDAVPAQWQSSAAQVDPRVLADLLAMGDKYFDLQGQQIRSRERMASMEHERLVKADDLGYKIARLWIAIGAGFIAGAFALILLGHEGTGMEIIKLAVSAGLGFVAGYGWGKREGGSPK